MPFVEVDGVGPVHINTRGTRRPKCRFCKRGEAMFRCDYTPMPDFCCDKPMCDGCRTSVGEDRDYCPEHAGDLQKEAA